MYNHRRSVRRQIIKWVFVVYWLLIFEGSLRKWVLPQFNQIFFFIRDPFVLIIYWLVWKNKFWPHKSLLLTTGLFLAYLSAMLAFLQIITNDISFILVFYGWRNYFLYLPLAFIIGSQFGKDDLNRLLKQTLLLSIPIAVLVILQSLAPSDAVINRGISADYAFTPLGGGVLRTQGTFTSTLGQTMFVGSIVAMLISTLVLPSRDVLLRGVPLYVTTFAVITNLVISGSRSAFILTLLLIITAIAFSIFLGKNSNRTLTIITSTIFAGILVAQTFFYNQFYSLVNRAEGAAKSGGENAVIGSDILARIIDGFTVFISVASQVPLIGLGLGLGGNARSQLGLDLPVAIEDDWSRNIVELGPFVGLAFIFFRVALVIWLFNNAVKATTHSSTLLPILLTTFTATIFINGLLTGHGSVNGYGWLFAGFSIAANNLGQGYKEVAETSSRTLLLSSRE